MIALLPYLEQMLCNRTKNLVFALLLLSFAVCCEVPYFIKKASNEHYSSVIRSTPETTHFPLSIPLSTGEEPTGIEDEFSEDDEGVTNLSILSVSLSKSIYFPYQNNSQFQEFLNRPFTPPESITPNRI